MQTNLLIARGTILQIFKTEERLLSKKELVRITKFTNRCVKDVLFDLMAEKYLRKETSGYQLIKTFKSDPVNSNTPTPTWGTVQTDVLNIFNSLKGENLNCITVVGFLEGKYNIKQIKNCLARLTRNNKLVKMSKGLYTLPGETMTFKPIVAPSKNSTVGPGCGLYDIIRKVLPRLPVRFNSQLLIDLMPSKAYANRQIYNGITYLCDTGELTRIRKGLYSTVTPAKQDDKKMPKSEEVNVGVALEEKKEIEIQGKEVSCQEALKESKTFVMLQLGHKALEGDFAVVIKIGGAILRNSGWEETQVITMNWSHELKRMRIFPAPIGFKFFANDKGIHEVVIPLPEGTKYHFPKPCADHKDITIPIANVKHGKDNDLIISLHGVKGIDYV